ncbi:MAG: 1,4-alpha-glucan branching protein GlgB [Clostridia bacterium]|nr:1,4-alpha-glucan branching protein GlgB [Clostridia bacterium]
MSDENSRVFSEFDSFLSHQGTNYEVYQKLGAHPDVVDGVAGTRFAVWAPNAQYVSVICAKTGWENEQWMSRSMWDGGVWECFLPEVGPGDAYRYVITGADGVRRDKSDPYSFWYERRPANASIVYPLDTYQWNDWDYQNQRDNTKVLEKPMAIYEVHLGSWKKGYQGDWDEDGFLNYTQLADDLVQYMQYMGYTHIELMGICEHPFDLSWGYQVTGYYAPTSRYGTPNDFRAFVDKMHQAGIGVILDWVPAHFPKDGFAMSWFDGTPLYESCDPLRREFPVWGTLAFDHTKPEVRSFLIANAVYWIREFHIDALRVDAVASMLYNDYDRNDWRPNMFGGRMNLEGMDFMRQLNTEVCGRTSGYLIAEDSSAEWGITEDVRNGGLGFTFKWNMGWMNDTLRYFKLDPVYRKWHHGTLTHIADYAFTENYVLVLSHDEVVYGKGSMAMKAPGAKPERLGELKAMYTWQFTFPGKKLMFMGQEFAQEREWNVKESIDWHLVDDMGHRDVMQCVRNLVGLYKMYPSLYSDSRDSRTFEWVNRGDADRNILAYIRRNPWDYTGAVLCVLNLSPVSVYDYSCGVPFGGLYKRVFSTYDSLPGQGNPADGIPPLTADWNECDGYSHRITYSLRPFECIVLEFPR